LLLIGMVICDNQIQKNPSAWSASARAMNWERYRDNLILSGSEVNEFPA